MRQPRIDLDRELEALRLGDVAERALDVAPQLLEAVVLDVHRDGARLDLRQVEDVVDEREQVVARRVDGLRELHLLAGEVARRVLGELVREDQQAVERRAQLVRHVGEELGLEARGERQLLGLLFERLARLFDLGVLALHLDVLFGQQLGLLFQLLVGELQLLLLGLQFLRQRLRLLQQIFRARVGFDGVQDDADAFGELVEKRVVSRVEVIERGQLEDALDLPFEQDGQDHDVLRRRVAQARDHLEVIVRHAIELDLAPVHRALADEALRPGAASRRRPPGVLCA